MTRLLLVSGRYLLENPYRELRLKTLFEERGIEVVFALPSRQLNAYGYTEDVRDDPVFQRAGAVWLETVQDYGRHLRHCDTVLFGSWKSYGPLAEMARAAGKPVVNSNTTSGLDHWPHGVDYACVKGPFSKRQMLYFQEKLPGPGNLSEDQIIITGSIIHEHYHQEEGAQPVSLSREAFCKHYRLDPSHPIVALFPKGIGSFEKKIAAWFPDWPDAKRAAYNQWFLDKYTQICRAIREARCNLIIKMHPSAYAAYLTRTDQEYAYWQQFPWARTLAPEHTYACYQCAACGVGISTHSSLDLGYFNKPFIYVDSDQIEPPPAVPFHINHLCSLPLGPSSHWDRGPLESVNPWFPSWLGYFSRVEDLPGLLNEQVQRPIAADDRQRFIDEFWHKADGQAGERIVDFVADYIESWGSSKRIYAALKSTVKRLYTALRYRFLKALTRVFSTKSSRTPRT